MKNVIFSNKRKKILTLYLRCNLSNSRYYYIFGQPISLSQKDIPALYEKAKLIKANGTKAINQIQHAGVLASKEFSKLQPVGPSAKKYDKILEEKRHVK